MTKNFKNQKGGAINMDNMLGYIIIMAIIVFVVALILFGVSGGKKLDMMVAGGSLFLIVGMIFFAIQIFDSDLRKSKKPFILGFLFLITAVVILGVYGSKLSKENKKGSKGQQNASLTQLQKAVNRINNMDATELSASLNELKDKLVVERDSVVVNPNDFDALKQSLSKQVSVVSQMVSQVSQLASMASLDEQKESSVSFVTELHNLATMSDDAYVTENGIDENLQVQKAVASVSYLLSVCNGQCNEKFAGLALGSLVINHFLQ